MIAYHKPVLLEECISGLNIKPNGTYVDVTYGGGGHSREILKHLKNGKLIAFDQDNDAAQNIIKDKRFQFIRHNYRYMGNFLKYLNINKVDGILADLGISSHQIDAPERGFSYNTETLDMRMNQQEGINAREILNTYDSDALTQMFREYGEIQQAKAASRAIITYRNERDIETVSDLKTALGRLINPKSQNKFLAKLFQALRIEVNRELDALKDFLLQTGDMLNPGGRLCIMSYHSLEDRFVKNYMRSGNLEGDIQKDFYGNVSTPFKIINRKVIVPSDTEQKENSRSRSAKLRIAEKI